MEVAIIADTHVPDRASGMPDAFRERVRAADHVVHAGDFTAPDVLDEVRELSSELTAVHGNMDPEGLGLPAVAAAEVGGVTFVVTHGDEFPGGEVTRSREEWLDAVAGAARAETGADELRVAVGGHSHALEDAHHDGVRVLNPGSVTGADPAEAATMLTADVVDGDLDVTVHEA